jgi:glycerophosphoryl diester phosphodiesterase
MSHRGLHQKFPENTLAAFDAAVSLGVDGIETDLRVSSLGEIVLFHDRHAPSGSPVSSLSRAELSRDVGYSVPLLQEALEQHPDTFWNLEIKDYRHIKVLGPAIESLGARHRLLITSFWHPAIAHCPTHPTTERGLLICCRPLHRSKLVASVALDPPIDWVVWDAEWIDEEIVNELASHEISSMVYGVKSKQEHDMLAQLPIEGIITDTPEFLLSVRK